MKLLENLDRNGEGDSVFCYLVIFNKLPQELEETLLAEFLRENRSGPRHKILYKSSLPCPGPKLSTRYTSRNIDLVLTSPPYGKPYMRSNLSE
jgi:hypothetical protein